MRRALPLVLALGLLLVLPAFAPGAQQQRRVINGDPVAEGDYPWAVALVEAGASALSQFCGGSLISPTIVVTAAHCVIEPEARVRPADIEVYAGPKRNLSQMTRPDPDFHQVAGIALHPSTNETADRFDVALLRLTTPVPGDVHVPFAAVGPDPAPGTELRIAGWGLTEDGLTNEMHEADVDASDRTDCEDAWALRNTEIFDDMLCALGMTPFTDTCSGDSGGPIMIGGPSKSDPADWTLLGATSFGSDSCLDPDLPGVYTRFAQASVHDLLLRATDTDADNDPPEIASLVSGFPSLTPGSPKVGDTVTCSIGTAVFLPSTSVVTLRLTRSDGKVLGSGAGPLSYVVDRSDVGSTIACTASAINPNSGPIGDFITVRSSSIQPPPAPPTPTPPQPAPTPEPAVVPPPPVVLPFDGAAPQIDGFSRRCTRRRRCTLRLRVADTAPTYGVLAPQVKLTVSTRRRCVRDGRRRTCTKRTVRTLRARRSGTTSTFVVDTGVLPRGRHVLSVTVRDVAGNRRRLPFTAAFSVT